MVLRVVGSLCDLKGLDLDLDLAILVRELEGVGDEVDQDLLVPLLVAVDLLEVFLVVVIHDHSRLDVLLRRQELQSFEGLVHCVGQTEIRLVKLEC